VNAALSEEDPIVQLEVDDSRHILYARSEKGTIQASVLSNFFHVLVVDLAKIASLVKCL
jgi:hypothetical protein